MKKLIKYTRFSLALIIGVFTVFALFFTVVKLASVGNNYYLENYGGIYSPENGRAIEASANGWNFLSFNVFDYLSHYTILYGLTSWFVLLSGVIGTVLIIVSLFMKKDENAIIIQLTVIFIILFALLCYLLCGANELRLYDDWVLEQGKERFILKTFTHLPFIIVSVFAVLYIVVMILGQIPAIQRLNIMREKVDKGFMEETNKIELVKRYKELFESGVITEEEFNEKKRSLL